jgi:hypothetical protein
MLSIFRALTDRLKALFATSAALELESEFIARDAERHAELLRQADRYAEGLHEVAGQLRQQVVLLSAQKPTATVLPAITHLQADISMTPTGLPLFQGQESNVPLLEAPKSSTKRTQPRRKGAKP